MFISPSCSDKTLEVLKRTLLMSSSFQFVFHGWFVRREVSRHIDPVL